MSELLLNNSRIVISLPNADSVSAIGAFNNWSTAATPLSKIDEQKWELRSTLSEQEIEQLSFYVILQGQRSGRVVNYRDVIQS